MRTAEYIKHADRLASDIRDGLLRPGQRLPPLRRFAFDEGIAFSTATRVYGELTRRGLVSGEVGRGTFVRARPHIPFLSEPDRDQIIDLEFNSTIVEPADMAILSEAMIRVASGPALASASAAASSEGPWLRFDLLAAHLSRPDWAVRPEHLLCSAGGRQAIAAAFAALAEPGKPVGLEATTYPMAKAIAHRLGLPPVPLAMDEEGVLPDALAKAHNEMGTRLFYVQPTLHNPLGTTMGMDRRRRIADFIEAHDVVVVEDAVYSFLAPNAPPPIASLASDKVILIDSFSKRGFSGVPVGFLCAPSLILRDLVSASLRSGAWLPAAINLALLSAMLEAGSLKDVEKRKRRGAALRQEVLRLGLAAFDVKTDAQAFHAWLRLPPPWRSDAFCLASLRAGVAVTPGENFAIQPGLAPDAVRLAFSAVSPKLLQNALARLSAVLSTGPMDSPGYRRDCVGQVGP